MDIVCFSHLRWGFVFQRPNHLMSRFAREGRVFFIEEPAFDDEARGPWMETASIGNGLTVCTPHLPPLTSPELALRTQRQLLHELFEVNAIRPQVLWFYTPMALPLARHLSAPLVVYDCMDELSAFQGAPPELLALEQELLERAHLVFTGGHSLYRAKRTRHPHVHAFPSSVDVAHFAQARSVMPEPEDQRDLRRPRVGFFGVIDERLDLELVAGIADARPSWQLVMLGPVAKIEESDLPRRPNIHWLGGKRYAQLPSYLAGWDVALMPFAINEATRFISPTKTLEYLAAGRPVVSTAIADVVQPYGEAGAVSIATDRDGFVSAIERAFERPDAQRAAAEALLSTTSWDRTWSAMHALLLSELGKSQTPIMENQAHV